MHSVNCKLYSVLQFTTIHYYALSVLCPLGTAIVKAPCYTTSTSAIWRWKVKAPSTAGISRHFSCPIVKKTIAVLGKFLQKNLKFLEN